LTKVDMVLPERVDAVTREVRSFLRGTFLQDAPIFPFSNITGQGFEEFYEGLGNLVQSLTPKQTDGIFRLPVERTFSVKGYGTIVSGIPVSGSAGLGDQVIVYPQAVVGRIKAIQVYQTQSERVQCGQCAAINVTQWDHGQIARGDVITVEGWFAPSNWYLCELEVLALDGLYLKNGASVKFHTGTSESSAVVYLLEGDRAGSGEHTLVQVQLNQPIVASPLDRYIMRSLSPVQTIGGGSIVEALDQKLRRSKPEVVEDARQRALAVRNDATFAEYVIRTAQDHVLTAKVVAQRIKKTLPYTEIVVQTLAKAGTIMVLEQGLLIHAQTADQLKKKLLDRVSHYHQAEPGSPGIDIDSCQIKFAWPKPVFLKLLKDLETEGKIRILSSRVCLADHSARFGQAEQGRMQQVESLFRDRLFSPPDQTEIMDLCGINAKEMQSALRLLAEHGRIVRVSGDLFFHAEALARAKHAIIDHIKREKRLESVQFKYLIDATRKYALPLLDYFDRVGITKRAPDNTRYLGPKA
jgi:selenocysteine-specific elongation factor